MEIIELLTHANKDIYLDILEDCEWIAGKFLAKIIKNDAYKSVAYTIEGMSK